MKQTTIYVDEQLIRLAKLKGINISQICRATIEEAVGGTSASALRKELEQIEERREVIADMLESQDEEENQYEALKTAYNEYMNSKSPDRKPSRIQQLSWLDVHIQEMNLDMNPEKVLKDLKESD